jgi:formate dehydrogenase subunit delta
MMSTDERLAYMADQIARNFLALGHDSAVRATADHIASFWDPSMKARAFELLRNTPEKFTPLAAAALCALESKGAPPPQTAATVFAPVDQPGGSDAG